MVSTSGLTRVRRRRSAPPPGSTPRPGWRSAYRSRMARLCAAAAVAALILVAPAAQAHERPGGWGSGTLTDTDLHSLVAQMTPAEEVGMVHGEGDPPNSPGATADCAASAVGCVGEAGWIPGVRRLGIPPLRMTDGPAGIRLRHVETALPAPVGLAATFDTAAARSYGATVGRAGRATNQDVWLGPMVNQVNYPTGGRNFETLGEDPFLASQLAAQEVTGVQSEGLVAELKHYIENDFENGRTSTSVRIDDQTLHETELQAFEAGIRAGAGSVMCSYNRINDSYGCGNDTVLHTILRQQLAFTGFVQSDWGAVHRTTDLFYGTDIEQPGNAAGTSNFGAALTAALQAGTPTVAATADFPAYPAISAAQWQAALDTAVFHILSTMNQAGLLEGTRYGSHYTDGTPYVPPRPDLASLQAGEYATAQSIAEESATLLKNDGTLPLSRRDLSGPGGRSGTHHGGGGVLVLGPTAIAPYLDGGGSSHVTPYDPAVGPYDALRSAAGAGADLGYLPGYDLDGQVVPATALAAPDPAAGYPNWTLTPADAAFAGQPGLLRQQITTDPVAPGDQPVLYTGAGAAPDRVDRTLDVTGAAALPAGTAWRWSGQFTAPANPGGTGWQLKVFVQNQASAQLFVDGLGTAARAVNLSGYPAAPATSYAGLAQAARSHDPAHPDLQQGTYSVTLAPGATIHLDLRLVAGAAPAQIQLRWVPPDDQATSIAAAVSAARSAGTVVVFAYDEGTEGRDRGISDQVAGLTLPGYQDALIAAVAAANPRTVVVLNTGDPVFMPWAGSVAAILEMWYPGQRGGQATADVLLGRANPGGRLPVTFPGTTGFPSNDPACTDTTPTGNCPLYPGVVGPSPFLPGATTSYRTITGMAVNGIYQGYRWYDRHGVAPLYPFGYGLSYTSFAYSGLTVRRSRDGGLEVSFRVRNTGRVAGSDVPQVYLGAPSNQPAGVQFAVESLVAFDRVTLAPGRSREVSLHVAARQLAYWSSAGQRWVPAGGWRTVSVGASSRDLRSHTAVLMPAA
jgi:beta-glucosidase